MYLIDSPGFSHLLTKETLLDNVPVMTCFNFSMHQFVDYNIININVGFHY